ncbi:MAG TPA: LamG-like jellyroll fold domain-containing protein, partial [Clostridia bacterium]|nr:LamG-like jellyroll fold domain-containing protein [Clostridia bacterium]
LENGTTPGIAGKVLKCLRFDGLDDYVELPDDYADFSTGLTFALWAKPLPVPGGWARFVEMANGAFNNNNILFARNGLTDRISFQVYEGPDGRGTITTRDLLVTNQWQHLAVTLDGTGNAVVYYNGVAMASGSTAVPVNVIRANARLGRSNWTFDTYYAGYMDDVRIYDRPLSAAAIQALAAGSGSDESPATIVSVTATVPNTALSNTPPGVLTLTRTGSTASALTVNYALQGTAVNGTHYTNLPGTVIIPAGAASAQVFVTPIDHSFTDAFRTVILQVTGTASYAMAESDAATVTIANNDDTAPPAPRVATAESRIINVWFDEPVSLPSATALANYSLNAGELSITNATLTSANISAGGYHLCVTLQVSAAVPENAVLTVSGVQDSAGNQASYQVPVYAQLAPTRIVGNEYHGSRVNAFNRVTDGTVNNVNNATTGYDTFDGNSGLTHFTGLLYQEAREFSAIKVDLGQQFSDGGSWAAQPSVYLLKNVFDTDLTRPETHPSWVQVPARLVSGSQFNSAVDPNPSLNTPIVFDLTALSPDARTAYGWAVGGVTGDGTVRFISISELRGYGRVTGTNNLSIVHHPQSQSVVDGSQAIFTVSAKGTLPITYQWQRDQLDIPGANLASYTIPLVSVGDNAASLRVIVTNPWGSLTSQVAVLNVAAPSGPTLVAASMDAAIDVWFDQPVSPNAADPANYQLNDPGLTITGITQDAYLYRAVLNLSGIRTVNGLTVQVSNVQNLFGQTMTQQSVPVQSLAWPVVSVTASTYQQGRGTALTVSTNGIVLHDFTDFWATFGRDETDFVGLRYTEQMAFSLIKIDLGRQFGDGGSWAEYPRVYILKEPVDTDRSLPDQDPRWVEAVGAVLISGSRFDPVNDAADGEVPPNSPITFDLSSVPLAQRTGYGWAVGGVQGDNAGFPSFVSISELRGFGVPAANPSLTIRYVGGEVIISWPATAAGYVLHSSPVLGSSANWQPTSETPELEGGFYVVKPAVAGAPKYYRLQ